MSEEKETGKLTEIQRLNEGRKQQQSIGKEEPLKERKVQERRKVLWSRRPFKNV